MLDSDYTRADVDSVCERLSYRFGLTVTYDASEYPNCVFHSPTRYTVTIRKNGLEAGTLYATDYESLFKALRNFEKGCEFAFAIAQDETSATGE